MKRSVTFALSALCLAGGMIVPTACRGDAQGTHERRGHDRERDDRDANEGDEENEENETNEKHEHRAEAVKSAPEDSEDVIHLAQAPELVRAAIAKLASSSGVVKVERAVEDGLTSFEVEYKSGDETHSATLSERGEVMELERPAGELSDDVKSAIARATNGAKIVKAESVQSSYFEVVVQRDGHTSVIKIYANGLIEEAAESHEQ